jgi:hypothetical protein
MIMEAKEISDNMKGHLEAVIQDAEKKIGCSRLELQWKVDKHGAIHIRKRPDGQ